MRRLAIILLGLAIGCGLFGFWGMFTAAGTSRFDEMDGLIPFFAGVASAPLLIAAAVTWWLSFRMN